MKKTDSKTPLFILLAAVVICAALTISAKLNLFSTSETANPTEKTVSDSQTQSDEKNNKDETDFSFAMTPTTEGEIKTDSGKTKKATDNVGEGEVKPGEKGLMAITFDDGPGKTTTQILDVLERNGVKATFFVVGYNIDAYKNTIKRAVDMGCEIGNHSNEHKNFTKLNGAQIEKQIDIPNDKIKAITGKDVKLCRVPGGNYKGIEGFIGMPLIQWTIDTNDWRKKDAANKGRSESQRNADIDSIVNHVIKEAAPGRIILMHDIYNFSADTVEKLVPAIIKEGYNLVTVSELFDYYGEELENSRVYTCAKAE